LPHEKLEYNRKRNPPRVRRKGLPIEGSLVPLDLHETKSF
jgi:hypothetical protein